MQVESSSGQGQGCVIHGEGKIQTEGEFAQLAKEKFPSVSGALVVRVKEFEALL